MPPSEYVFAYLLRNVLPFQRVGRMADMLGHLWAVAMGSGFLGSPG